jgi:carbon-monoxide dehydrogenase large subunit
MVVVSETDTPEIVGTSVPRIGVERFVRAQGRYIANVDFPAGGLHACFARSTVAHGYLRSVDAQAVLAPDGPAEAVLTGAEARARSLPMPASWKVAGHAHPRFWALAVDRVRYVGDPIAIVGAEDPHAARRAAGLVRAEIDPLPIHVDPRSALDSPPGAWLYEEVESNLLYESAGRMADRPADTVYPVDHGNGGAVRAPAAGRLLERSFRTARVAGLPMEPRGCIAEWSGGTLRFVTSTQVPTMVRRVLADVLELPESAIEVVTPDVGGGFGIKAAVSREEVAVALLALATGRPVRWIETTIEHLENAPAGRDERVDVSVRYDDGGRITALHVDTVSDVGAYSSSPLSSVVEAAAMPLRMPGLYDVGELSYRSRAAMTNKATLGTYRGVATPIGVFIIHRVMQEIARELGRDVVEVERANLLAEGVTQRTPAGMLYDPGQYERGLDTLLEALDYDALKAERERRREAHDPIRLGVAVIAQVEQSAVSMDGLGLRFVSDWEEAFVRVNPDCTMEVRLAVGSSGQAHETTFAQLAAGVLGVAPETVRVTVDTSRGVYGSGAWGSRVSVVSGGAVVNAATAVRQKLCAIAAGLLDTPVETVELVPGGAVRAFDGRELSLSELCEVAYFATSRLPAGITPGLAAFESYALNPITTAPYAWHGCVIEVDTRSADVRIRSYVVISDSGTVINPALLDEQIRGGIAQGIGEALFEAIEYGPDGVSAQRDLFGYRAPRASDMPEEITIRHIETPSPLNVFGIKGGGENGAIGAPGALAVALTDALGDGGFRADALPIGFADLVRAGTAVTDAEPASAGAA